MRNSWAMVLGLSGFLSGCIYAQSGAATEELRVIVAKTDNKIDSAIVVPPSTGVQMRHRTDHPASIDLTAWLRQQTPLNGLASPELYPWHVVIVYDEFDEDGDNTHSGVYEEYWAGPRKYKRIYKSDNFNQTDYVSGHGLFRSGEQKFPGVAEEQVRNSILDPFFHARSVHDVIAQKAETSFGEHKLDCLRIESIATVLSDPEQFCFTPESSALRYVRGSGWDQISYNDIVTFQGTRVARDVEVTHGGKAYLRLSVKTLESLPEVKDADFAPLPDAKGPIEKGRIAGVTPTAVKRSAPMWPPALQQLNGVVMVEIVVGKDGHVKSAHAVSGPAEAYKFCEEAARKWEFLPYRVLDTPVEVETKLSFQKHFVFQVQ